MKQVRQLKQAVPFAVCGANTLLEVRGRKVRGRLYPWGVVEVENPDHCDFIKLRTMLITQMQDLQEVTQEVHYESYRSERLSKNAPVPKRNTYVYQLIKYLYILYNKKRGKFVHILHRSISSGRIIKKCENCSYKIINKYI